MPNCFRWIKFSDFLILLGCLSISSIQSLVNDPGMGWHILNGQKIIRDRAPVYVDSILSSAVDRSWVADQWLSDVILAGIFNWAAWGGIAIFSLFCFGFVYFALLPFWIDGSEKRSNILISLVTLWVFKMSQVQLVARPLIFGFICFTLLLLILKHISTSQSNQTEIAKQDWRNTALLMVLFMVWANLHPSFVVGLIVLTIYSIVKFLDRLAGSTGRVNCIYLLIASIMATLVNPYGWKLHQSILWLTSGSLVKSLYSEWQPLNFHAAEGFFFEVVFFLVVLAWIFSCKIKPKLWYLLNFVVLAHLAVNVVRMLPYFAIFAARAFYEAGLFLAHRFMDLFSHSIVSQLKITWAKFEACEVSSNRERFGRAVLVLLLSCTFIYQAAGLSNLRPGEDLFPYKSMEFLNNYAKVKATPSVVLNHMDFGGFIEYFGDEKVRPVIDDRTSLLGEEIYKRYFSALKVSGDWSVWAQELGANFILLKPRDALAQHLKQIKPQSVLVEEDAGILFDVLVLLGKHDIGCTGKSC